VTTHSKSSADHHTIAKHRTAVGRRVLRMTTTALAPPAPAAVGTPSSSLAHAHDLDRSADRRAFLDGGRAMLPLLLGVAPFGLVIGVTIAESGAPHLAGWSLSWLVYAGSAQLAAVGLLAGGASAAIVVATVAVINLRIGLYTAALAPHWRGTSWWWRLLAGYLMIDPTFAVGSQSYNGSRSPRLAHRHYLGAALALWAGWLTVTGLGLTVGAVLPSNLRLESIGPLYIVALVVLSVRTTATGIAVGVAIATSVGASLLPLHLGPAIGMVTGLVAGSIVLRRTA
jgi:predicted branched-subunit amino acid permease